MHPLALVSVTVVLRGNSQAISVSHLTGDEILSPEQFPVKKKNNTKKTSPLWRRCQNCWLSAYLSFVTKPGPISSVMRKKSFWTMSVSSCLHFYPPEIFIRLMQIKLSPFEKCKWGLLLCSVLSVWQQVTFLSFWQWKVQVRICAANRNKVILQSGFSLECACTSDLQLSS